MDRDSVRPLWNAVVACARNPRWYAEFGVADTREGRFDAVSTVLALTLLRMEREPELVEASVRLTEIFIEDMDGQMRNGGVGDLAVGKQIGRLMAVLGGRLETLRAHSVDELAGFAERNHSFRDGFDPAAFAPEIAHMAARLDATSASDLLHGRIAP